MIMLLKRKIKNLSNSRLLIRQSIRNFIIDNVRDENFDTVIDIGSGKSPYKQFIKYKKYYCLDNENRTDEDDVIIADANKKLPIEDNFVDLIICTEVLEHLQQPENFIKESYRILKPGGKMILTTPFIWQMHECPNDYFRYTKFGLEYLFIVAGFESFIWKQNCGGIIGYLQLLMLKMKKKRYFLLVIIFNLIGVSLKKFEKENEFYISNLTIVKK